MLIQFMHPENKWASEAIKALTVGRPLWLVIYLAMLFLRQVRKTHHYQWYLVLWQLQQVLLFLLNVRKMKNVRTISSLVLKKT